jgi:hypothetical protein
VRAPAIPISELVGVHARSGFEVLAEIVSHRQQRRLDKQMLASTELMPALQSLWINQNKSA